MTLTLLVARLVLGLSLPIVKLHDDENECRRKSASEQRQQLIFSVDHARRSVFGVVKTLNAFRVSREQHFSLLTWHSSDEDSIFLLSHQRIARGDEF